MDIEQFIEENIDLVDNNNFAELYIRCNLLDRGKLTEVLYACGIDPLDYMTEIPEWFAAHTDLTSIVIPNSVKIIGRNTFFSCSRLTSVTISNSITNISGWAFAGCGNIDITYSGTKQEWEDLVVGKQIFPSTTYVCNCSDGVVKKTK